MCVCWISVSGEADNNSSHHESATRLARVQCIYCTRTGSTWFWTPKTHNILRKRGVAQLHNKVDGMPNVTSVFPKSYCVFHTFIKLNWRKSFTRLAFIVQSLRTDASLYGVCEGRNVAVVFLKGSPLVHETRCPQTTFDWTSVLESSMALYFGISLIHFRCVLLSLCHLTWFGLWCFWYDRGLCFYSFNTFTLMCFRWHDLIVSI